MTSSPDGGPRLGWIAAVAIGLALVGGLAACAPRLVVACEEHEISIFARDYDSTVVYIPIAPNTADIPEFHDCQRLMVEQDYGPLAAIWAAEGLENLFTKPAPPAGDPEAMAVAQIFNYGYGERPPVAGATSTGSYPPLGLEAGFSCLYLWRDPAAPNGWQARLVHQERDVTDCNGSRTLRSVHTAPSLHVLPVPFHQSAGDTVPPVARWDTDPAHGVSYIGIRCGEAWCEVGQPDLRPSLHGSDDPVLVAIAAAIQPDEVGGLVPAAPGRRIKIKGWFDRQELAILDENGRLAPSGVVGTIVPHPVLDEIGRPGTSPALGFAGRWVPSAYLHLTSNYKSDTFPLEAGITRLFTCEGTAAECGVEVDAMAGPTAPTGWWNKLVSPTGRTTYRTVRREDHSGKPIPSGAARWRWLETDEKTWIRCGVSCCTIN